MFRVCMINVHGHLKKEGNPIGGHPDTGGQIVYVMNLAKSLGEAGVKVDLFTRRFKDKEWAGYDEEFEQISKNVKIIRISCGSNDFVPKEEIWAHLGEFTKGIEDYYKQQKLTFDIINTHYADAGICGVILKARTGKPLVHVGHSLGAIKLKNVGIGLGNFLSVNKRYSFHTRLFAERTTLNWADGVIVATEEERYQQYGLAMYEGAVDIEDPKFRVIPPGVNTNSFFPPAKGGKLTDVDKKSEKTIDGIMEEGIDPSRRGLPAILMVGRLDPKRNIIGLIEAYAASKQMQDMANLIISSGGLLDPTMIKNWEGMHTSYKVLLKDIRKIIVKYGLQGKIVLTDIFKYDDEYPGILRYAARNKWIYVNPALHEHRGIAVLEAMASGLPIVCTGAGCTRELIDDGNTGLIIEPTDIKSIMNGILMVLTDQSEWDKYAKNAAITVKKTFSWDVVSDKFLRFFSELVSKKEIRKPKYVLLPSRYLRKPSDKSEKDLIDDLRTFLFNVAEGKRQASKVARDLADVIIDEIKQQDKRPFVFAMAGETGAGKTTIANKLSRTLNNLGYESVIFRMEDYYVELPKEVVEKRVSLGAKKAVGPHEIDIATLNEHIRLLMEGKSVVSPVSNVKTNSRKMRTVEGKPLFVIIVEGCYCDKLEQIDMLVHFDIPFEQLREQRTHRDDAFLYPKGDKVRNLVEDVIRSEHEYIEHTNIKNSADLRLNGRYEIFYRYPFRTGPLI